MLHTTQLQQRKRITLCCLSVCISLPSQAATT